MRNNAPKIKICGLFQESDIEAVNEAVPDFIGFVFCKKSSRYVDFKRAHELKSLINPNIKVVGVFVDEPVENIIELFKARTIDIAQLHGNEDEKYIEKLKQFSPDLPVIKAKHGNFEQIDTNADYLLFDNYNPISIGGSGKTFDWSLIPKTNKPFFLAGGLNACNIIEAIKRVKPYAVDISSGVETNGCKDKEKITKIVKIVREYNQ